MLFIRGFDAGESTSRRWLVIFTFVNTLGLFTHIWFVFVLTAEFVAVLLWFGKAAWTKFILSAASTLLVFGALWSPVVWERPSQRRTIAGCHVPVHFPVTALVPDSSEYLRALLHCGPWRGLRVLCALWHADVSGKVFGLGALAHQKITWVLCRA